MRITKVQARVLLELVEQKIVSEHHIRIDYDYLLGASRDELLRSLTELKASLDRLIRHDTLFRRMVASLQALRDFHQFCSGRHA